MPKPITEEYVAELLAGVTAADGANYLDMLRESDADLVDEYHEMFRPED